MEEQRVKSAAEVGPVSSYSVHGVHVIRDFPPNYAAIVARFPIARRLETIFTYAPNVYMRSGIIDEPLAVHESVHLRQQGDDPAGWWSRYLVDDAFRYREELEAHRAELDLFCSVVKDRNLRAKYFGIVLSRLCGPLYGKVRSRKQVKKDLMK